jgi:hypothetical protein
LKVTVATANWNGFWGKYGDKWTECVNAMSPAPDRVIVASDEPIDTKFEVVICQTKKLGPMRNAALEIADTEWFVPADLDDLPMPNYIANLNNDYDIHSFALQIGNEVYKGNAEQWDKAFHNHAENPLISCSAYKTELGKKIKYRDVGWEDWAFWLDMKKAGATVFWDDTVRYIYRRPPNSLSQQDIQEKTLQIRKMKARWVW